jgi:hypothetical protein
MKSPPELEETQKQENKSRLLGRIALPDAVIIAAIPVLTYLLLYVYAWGHLGVFKIPIALISFRLVDVFTLGFGLLGLAVWIYYFVDFGLGLFLKPGRPKPIADRLGKLFISFVLFMTVLFMFGAMAPESLGILMGIALLSFFDFVLPLITRRGKGTYLEKLKAQDERGEQRTDESLTLNGIISRLAPNLKFAVITTGIALFLVYSMGRASALSRRQFHVANTAPETVVLWWISDERAICAPFDRSTKEIERSFIILDITSTPNTAFRLEKIGPLRLKEEATSQTPTPKAIPTLTATPTFIPTATPKPIATPSLTPTLASTPVLSSTPSPTPR